jgi:O-antigen/teichoic acid export membrane protein
VKADLAKSSLTGVAQFVLSTALVFAAIPIFMSRLGEEAYGVFSLVGVVGNVNVFANLGLNAALIRFLASQGKCQESDHDILVNLVLVIVAAALLGGIGMIFRQELLHAVGVPERLFDEAELLWIFMLVGSVIILIGQTFTGVIDAQQKIYLTNLVQMVYNIAYWSFVLIAVLGGFGLKGVGLSVVLAAAIWFVLVVVVAYRLWGKVGFTGLRGSFLSATRKQLAYGLQLYAAGLVNFFHEPFTKIMVSHFLGLAEVGFYDIGLRVRNLVVGMATKLLYPLYPKLARDHARPEIGALVNDVEQKTLFAILPVVGVLILATPTAAPLFFPQSADIIAATIVWIVSGYLLFSVTAVPIYFYLMAEGYAAKTIYLQAVIVVVNAAAFLLLLRPLGYDSAPVANALAIAASGIGCAIYQKRYLGNMIIESYRQVAVLAGAFASSLVCGWLLELAVRNVFWKLAVGPLAIVAITVAIYRQFARLKPVEIERYVGSGTTISRLCVRLLCKPETPGALTTPTN